MIDLGTRSTCGFLSGSTSTWIYGGAGLDLHLGSWRQVVRLLFETTTWSGFATEAELLADFAAI